MLVVGAGRGHAGRIIHKLFVNAQRVCEIPSWLCHDLSRPLLSKVLFWFPHMELLKALDSNTEEIMTLNGDFLVFEIHLLFYTLKYNDKFISEICT